MAIVGGVAGHGPDAAGLAMFVRARFAAFAAKTSDPAELLSLANAALIEHVGSGRELVDLGEGVVVFTDGATSVRRHGELGVEGLARLVKPLVLLPASGIASKAKEAVLDWADGPLRDDLCLFVLRPKRGAS